MDDLDRDLASEPRVPSPVDLSHTAPGERREHLVGTQTGPDFQGHGKRRLAYASTNRPG
jgi:hypothetical protein